MIRSLVCLALGATLVAGCKNPDPDATPTKDKPSDSPEQPLAHFEVPGAHAMTYPARVASGPDGVVYVSDPRSDAVYGYKNGGRVKQLVDLGSPLGLAVHGDMLVVGCDDTDTVELFDLASETWVRTLGTATMPNDIAITPDGKMVLVADSLGNQVIAFDMEGTVLWRIDEMGDMSGKLRFPSGVAADESQIVIGDQINHRIQVFDHTGTYMFQVGGEVPGEATNVGELAGRFTRVQDVAIHDGDILVLDSFYGHVQVLDPQGQPKGYVGSRGECANCVDLALGLEIDSSGNLLMTDPERNRWVAVEMDLRDIP